uniref:Uncharacterized protein n=1 Tax=Panagrellus redivivus TaxID=6233 RepID=A0A7E4VYF5_PANRE
MSDPSDNWNSLIKKMVFFMDQIQQLVGQSKTSARPSFPVSEVEKCPDIILRVHYLQSGLQTKLNSKIEAFKDLDRRVKNLKRFAEDCVEGYVMYMEGGTGWYYVLQAAEHELNETSTYVGYLDKVLAWTMKG